MPYLVTSLPPARETGLRVHEVLFFDKDEDDSTNLGNSIVAAEKLLHDGHTQVQVWKLQGTPELQTLVKWNGTIHTPVAV